MNLRITASYAATDGSMPESVDVVWDDFHPGDHPTGVEIADVLNYLFAAPGVRRPTYAAEPVPEPRAFRAGTDIPMGMRLAWGSDGFTIYPMGDASGPPAGVALESIAKGDRMVRDDQPTATGLAAWRKGAIT